MNMPGDDMEPRIKNGAPMLVDTRAREIAGNGTYVLEYQRRTLVRNVGSRIGPGLALSCENQKYKETLIKDTATAKWMGLKVIGRVRLGIVVQGL
jgi:phage repressor protein C with HTH and peptisase S24 domain